MWFGYWVVVTVTMTVTMIGAAGEGGPGLLRSSIDMELGPAGPKLSWNMRLAVMG